MYITIERIMLILLIHIHNSIQSVIYEKYFSENAAHLVNSWATPVYCGTQFENHSFIMLYHHYTNNNSII